MKLSHKMEVHLLGMQIKTTYIIKEKVKKDLPIECKVKYELDGKELSANEIAGKSGKVKITLQYTNKEEKEQLQ